MAATEGTLFGFKNPFSGMFSGSGFNPFKRPKLPSVDDPKYMVGGVWREDLFNRDMDDYEAQTAKISQFQEGVMGIGEEKDYKIPTHLKDGGPRPPMQEISASPVGAPLNISLPRLATSTAPVLCRVL